MAVTHSPTDSPWLVLKFGGTSVATASGWHRLAELVRSRQKEGYCVAVVCSAIRGITESLERWLLAANADDRQTIWSGIKSTHQVLAEDFDLDATALLQEVSDRLQSTPLQAADPARQAAVMAEGEWLSTRLGRKILDQLELASDWIDARRWLQTETVDTDSRQRQFLSARCEVQPRSWNSEPFAQNRLCITQGFVAATAQGETALLGRGGSDTSAAYLASRLGAERVEIWTDVPGVFSAAPQDFPEARLLRTLSYDEALELAATGARVVHPRSIRVCRSLSIPMLVGSSWQPASGGTSINRLNGRTPEPCIKAVTVRPGMQVLLLENRYPSDAVGFLAEVFSIIAGQGLSIDLVATSETTTTLALHAQTNHLDSAGMRRLIEALEPRCHVVVQEACASVSLIGEGVSKQLTAMLKGLRLPRTWLMSCSANDLNYSLVVPESEAQSLALHLHRRLLELNGSRDEIFGSGWETATTHRSNELKTRNV